MTLLLAVWQDHGIGVVSIVLALALLPTVWSAHKPALSTSILTGGAMVCLAGIFLTLEYWSSSATAGLTAVLWLVILAQTVRRRRRARDQSQDA